MRWWSRYWKLLLVVAVVAGIVLMQLAGRRGDNRIAPALSGYSLAPTQQRAMGRGAPGELVPAYLSGVAP